MKDLDFASRLNRACDDVPSIPPAKLGRQVYIARKMGVSEEAVSKWFAGESRPRITKMRDLAKLLNVDTGWLTLGVEPEMNRRTATLANKRTEGVVYLALGMSMLSGASCARPSDTDPRKGYVDFYMILNGEQIAVHASLGREVSPGQYEILVPQQFKDVRNVGFISANGTRTHILDLRPDLLDKHKERKGDSYAITVKAQAGGTYTTGRDEWPRISSIGELA